MNAEDERYFRQIKMHKQHRKPAPDWNLVEDADAVRITCRIGTDLLTMLEAADACASLGRPAGMLAILLPDPESAGSTDRKSKG